MKYLIIDASNTFFRARHIARANTAWDKVGFSLHVLLNSIMKCDRLFKPDHVVFALEGRSWRKDVYPKYKANRAALRSQMTDSEVEEDALFYKTYDEFNEFVKTKTNATVLRLPNAEADDMIACWIDAHPNDEHIVVSNDSDFKQLVAPNVKLYNAILEQITTLDGIFNDRMKPVIDKKTGLQKTIGDPEYQLFEKCMRGDTGDNVFSAYPGVREKSSKNKIGLKDAFDDRHKKGFNWNNLMLQRWVDHDQTENLVADRYAINRSLIDLRAQPEDIRTSFIEYVKSVEPKKIPMVGINVLQFCGKYELTRIIENAKPVSEMFNKPVEANHGNS